MLGKPGHSRERYSRHLYKSFDVLHAGGIETGKLLNYQIMKNWLAPLSVLGLSALGLAMASERGRERVRAFMRNGDPLGEVNKFFDAQLDAIQDALDRLADSLHEEQQV